MTTKYAIRAPRSPKTAAEAPTVILSPTKYERVLPVSAEPRYVTAKKTGPRTASDSWPTWKGKTRLGLQERGKG